MSAGEDSRGMLIERQVLWIDTTAQSWHLEIIENNKIGIGSRENYLVLSGETLCHYLLCRSPDTLIIARGPLPYMTGNKATVGFISPLTGVPNYGYVGGRVAAHLFYLGLDAIAFTASDASPTDPPVITVSGNSLSRSLKFQTSEGLPTGQRSAWYWLIDKELDGDAQSGSVLTLGEGAYLGYQIANLAAEGIYHAGRGGSGAVFARYASAMVLRGDARGPFEFFGEEDRDFARNPNRSITPLIDHYCHRLSSRTGGTIIKLYKTGGHPTGKNTLPAWNAQSLGYAMADAGDERILKATREGQTGCHWCQVHCRHYHSVPAEYAPDGEDLFLDDFEPAYAVHAMLGLTPVEDTFEARLDLIADVDERLIQPIEQMGLDVIDAGVGLAALFEGVERGLIPHNDVPAAVTQARGLGNLEAAVQAIDVLRTNQATKYTALHAIGNGPQELAEQYPEMKDIVFTCGKQTLGNPGHANALWTFLMPFSRFFGHYSGQIYKVAGELPPSDSDQETIRAFSQQIVERMLQREFFWILCNALSLCAFTFVIFSHDGKGNELSENDLLIRLLGHYGIHISKEDLIEFSRAFWAQSTDLKCQYGWQAHSAKDFPLRIYEALSFTLNRPINELQILMDQLIAEWKRQARELMSRYGFSPCW